jgi:hypothetical protein
MGVLVRMSVYKKLVSSASTVYRNYIEHSLKLEEKNKDLSFNNLRISSSTLGRELERRGVRQPVEIYWCETINYVYVATLHLVGTCRAQTANPDHLYTVCTPSCWSSSQLHGYIHRVGRVLSFFSSRRNWDSPNPSPAGECAPSTGSGRRGTLAGERGVGGLGESKFPRGDICTL